MRGRRLARMRALQAPTEGIRGDQPRPSWSRLDGAGPGVGVGHGPANRLKRHLWSAWSRWSGQSSSTRWAQEEASPDKGGHLHFCDPEIDLDHLDHPDRPNAGKGSAGPGEPLEPGPAGPPTAFDLLNQIIGNGIDLRVRAGSLKLRLHGTTLSMHHAAGLKVHRQELIALLDGTTCRWCRRPIVWRDMPGTIALGDGTSLHGWCRPSFEHRRVAQAELRAETTSTIEAAARTSA